MYVGHLAGALTGGHLALSQLLIPYHSYHSEAQKIRTLTKVTVTSQK